MSDPDRRVFEYFADKADTAQEVDYLAYAAFAFAKFEWFDKYVAQYGEQPQQVAIDKWISELPESRWMSSMIPQVGFSGMRQGHTWQIVSRQLRNVRFLSR